MQRQPHSLLAQWERAGLCYRQDQPVHEREDRFLDEVRFSELLCRYQDYLYSSGAACPKDGARLGEKISEANRPSGLYPGRERKAAAASRVQRRKGIRPQRRKG